MRIFITGITGSLGTAVVRALIDSPLVNAQIFGFSRDELRQKKFLKQYPNITLTLGDIRNRDRLLEATRGMDLIFHFAAAKHVDLLEQNPEESIDTNIDGTRNVLYAQRINKIPRVVLSSTDKAAYPVNTYGACKLVAERLVLRNPSNIVCRWGNVIASNGSVIPQFMENLKTDGFIDLTDPDMTRFWIKLETAADFLIEAALGQHGGLKIPEMRAAKVTDVAKAVSDIMNIPFNGFRIHGTRPGEKLNECLKTQYEGEEIHSHTARQFTPGELIETLEPVIRGLA